MEDPEGKFDRIVYVPRAARVAVGVLAYACGVVFLLVLAVAAASTPEPMKHDPIGASVLLLLLLFFGCLFSYVGARLVLLKSDREPLLSERGWRALLSGLGIAGSAA